MTKEAGVYKGLEDWAALVRNYLTESAQLKLAVRDVCLPAIIVATEIIGGAFKRRGKLLLCGNGGSAADSQHLAAEFVSLLSTNFSRPALPALALTTDTSILTARANDFGFDEVFSRQVEALGGPEDVLMVISTSGNSTNLLKAVDAAKAAKMQTIGLLGRDGGKLKNIVDCHIVVPGNNTQHVQESHIAICHILCGIVEKKLFEKGR